MKKILIMGLPGSGKTTLASELVPLLKAKWNNNEKLGIIAGRIPFASGMFFSIIKSPNDGTVSVEETRLDGASDHITLYLPHLGLLFSKKAFLQAKHFLEHSSFIHS